MGLRGALSGYSKCDGRIPRVCFWTHWEPLTTVQ